MQIAVVTPVYRTPKAWLDQCLTSVARQTVPCTHFVVSDGDDALDVEAFPDVQLIRLPKPHQDYGNTARAIGSVSAIARGFDAISYLDADNWLESDHLRQLTALQQRTGAAVCTCARKLVDMEGQLLGRCPEVDGENFVDTNCMFLTAAAIDVVSVWYRMPRKLVSVGDRVVWGAIKDRRISRAHLPIPTVNYRTNWGSHYLHFGKTPPAGAKQVIIQLTPSGQIASAAITMMEAISPLKTSGVSEAL